MPSVNYPILHTCGRSLHRKESNPGPACWAAIPPAKADKVSVLLIKLMMALFHLIVSVVHPSEPSCTFLKSNTDIRKWDAAIFNDTNYTCIFCLNTSDYLQWNISITPDITTNNTLFTSPTIISILWTLNVKKKTKIHYIIHYTLLEHHNL